MNICTKNKLLELWLKELINVLKTRMIAGAANDQLGSENIVTHLARKDIFYIPDFLIVFIDGTKWLVEIKPSRRLNNVIVQKKLIAAGLWCSSNGVSLTVITERELKALGLL